MKIMKVNYFDELKNMADHEILMKLYEEEYLHLFGGLDHIIRTKNQIKIFDIGCNGKANDVIIRRNFFAKNTF